ncbi:hypothetical protein KAS41_02310 [Candidatus Parcubacteria bacterium]|nr:hypothetical protein [Candidatus Parcubacteria bacterium]
MFEEPNKSIDDPKTPDKSRDIEDIIRNLSAIEILSLKINEGGKEIKVKIKTEKSSFEKEGLELKKKLTEKFEGWKITIRLALIEKEDEKDETIKDLEDLMLFGRKRKPGEEDPEIENINRFA